MPTLPKFVIANTRYGSQENLGFRRIHIREKGEVKTPIALLLMANSITKVQRKLIR
jgi:hypothetical protein